MLHVKSCNVKYTCHTTEVEPAVAAVGKTWFSYVIYPCLKVTLRCQLNGAVIELLFIFFIARGCSLEAFFLEQNFHYWPLTYPMKGFLTSS